MSNVDLNYRPTQALAFVESAELTHKYRPGVLLGRYPQKKENKNTTFQKWLARRLSKIKFRCNPNKYSQSRILGQINYFDLSFRQLSETELTSQIATLRDKLQRSGLQQALIFEAFAVIREVAGRTLGNRHFDTQLLGGWVMINGLLAQMQTGEGKTLAATLPACTAALAGIPVHIITSNDYLAARDAKLLQPLYKRLSLHTGAVLEDMDTRQRREIYAGHIAHTSAKQIAFDYLRDKIEIASDTGALSFQFKQIQNEQQHTSRLLLRGLCFAIIDEADSILIDEAVTPLIISKKGLVEINNEQYRKALQLASTLIINRHFTVNAVEHNLTLTEEGESLLLELAQPPGFWQNARRRNALITQALTAQHLFILNKHYIVRDDKIRVIDQLTGRLMEDRFWEQGLHQMIEAKEGCTITTQQEPLARISFQRFFNRYLKLAGTSGTLMEVRTELHCVYDFHVIKIPTHKPCKRLMLPERLYLTADAKWAALLDRITELNRLGRPLLIGTCSVAESEQISVMLTKHHLSHKVLNAKQDRQEAEIIALAGQSGSITVATNMAGRGTDIKLGDGVEQLGGLHVIAMTRNDARRIDRQLYGRCARQGDRGSTEAFISLQDERIASVYPTSLLKILSWFAGNDQLLPKFLAKIILRWQQKQRENRQLRLRKQLIKQDKHQASVLAFTGRFD